MKHHPPPPLSLSKLTDNKLHAGDLHVLACYLKSGNHYEDRKIRGEWVFKKRLFLTYFHLKLSKTNTIKII